jgi:hypothetical protein
MWSKLNVIEIETVKALNREGLPARRMPGLDPIASHWSDRCLKCDSPSRECAEIVAHSDYRTFCDPGEPDCMRCGMFLGFTAHAIRHFHGKCKPCKFADADPDCRCGDPARCDAYPRAAADRAHIVARWQVGYGDAEGLDPEGLDAPANIALLCHECHRRDPEPPTRREHLDWMCAERDRQARARRAFFEYTEGRPLDYASPILHSLVAEMLPDTHLRRAQAVEDIIEAARSFG